MRPMWTSAWLFVVALVLALVPMTANAAPLPAPTLLTPTAGATVDQPLFSWDPVAEAAYYEIEVALDDQFVTVTDPRLPTDPVGVAQPRPVYGTTYVPTFSYAAKTHYWHVRAVGTDGARENGVPPRRSPGAGPTLTRQRASKQMNQLPE